jgi:glycerol-3-phosphate dehydrogenase subunit B
VPRADVVVIGAGLAGLSCAAELAEGGASVFLAAKGMATTHWTHGGLDVAAPAGAATPRDGVRLLAAADAHPYRRLGAHVHHAVAAHLARTAAEGLVHNGSLDSRLVPVPTAIGTLRPAAILPRAQAAALEPWSGDGLVLVGFRRYRDAWPHYAARNLDATRWDDGPARIEAVEVDLPGLEALNNLNATTLARQFDDAAWRVRALAAVAGALPAGPSRIGMPAVLGLERHADAHGDAERVLGRPVFEVPSLPPSVPGLRLFEALRGRILARGGRLQIGFDVVDVERNERHVTAIHTEAAARTLRLAADSFVLATGGFAGAGFRALPDGSIHERVFGLRVAAPKREEWFSHDPMRPHPLETAGIDVDDELRPAEYDNVRVIGAALRGMHYLDERCGDGVALASARRAARSLAGRKVVAA